MDGINKVFLAGNLACDPELFQTQNGKSRTTLRLAVNRHFRTSDGQSKKEANFFSVIVWQNQAETCARYLKKGRPVLVEGRLNIRSFSSKEGEKKWITEIIAANIRFLPSRSLNQSENQEFENEFPIGNEGEKQSDPKNPGDLSQEIPF
ncbi:MAG: single-stranded DNA-binding protein [Candidatus Riflebacteria bacterium]|nr:single-stranded DNA-binding protein [Candidatus Riflebacteria bacterium]